MRALLSAGLLCALLLGACGSTPSGSGGGAPAAPAPTAVPAAPAAGTLAPAKTPTPSGMPSDDPYGYGY
jgi:hypothetical protein